MVSENKCVIIIIKCTKQSFFLFSGCGWAGNAGQDWSRLYNCVIACEVCPCLSVSRSDSCSRSPSTAIYYVYDLCPLLTSYTPPSPRLLSIPYSIDPPHSFLSLHLSLSYFLLFSSLFSGMISHSLLALICSASFSCLIFSFSTLSLSWSLHSIFSLLCPFS